MSTLTPDNRPAIGSAVRIDREPYIYRREYARVLRRGSKNVTVIYADGDEERLPYDRLESVSMVFVHEVQHAGTSGNGNPNYAITVSGTPDGYRFTLVTATDSGLGYEAENHRPGYREEPRPVIVQAHARSGKLWDMEALARLNRDRPTNLDRVPESHQREHSSE